MGKARSDLNKAAPDIIVAGQNVGITQPANKPLTLPHRSLDRFHEPEDIFTEDIDASLDRSIVCVPRGVVCRESGSG